MALLAGSLHFFFHLTRNRTYGTYATYLLTYLLTYLEPMETNGAGVLVSKHWR